MPSCITGVVANTPVTTEGMVQICITHGVASKFDTKKKKNAPSRIIGRDPLKGSRRFALLKRRASSNPVVTNVVVSVVAIVVSNSSDKILLGDEVISTTRLASNLRSPEGSNHGHISGIQSEIP